MAKSDRLYFENLVSAAECACKAADYLVECMTQYNTEDIKAMLSAMHELEHAGDTKKHEMEAALAKNSPRGRAKPSGSGITNHILLLKSNILRVLSTTTRE